MNEQENDVIETTVPITEKSTEPITEKETETLTEPITEKNIVSITEKITRNNSKINRSNNSNKWLYKTRYFK